MVAKNEGANGVWRVIYHDGKLVSNYFCRICKKAHIEPRGQHALRHTFATRCIEAGIPPVVLKKWLGHSDIHITLDTYTDVFSELNDGSVNLLDDYLKNL